MNKLGQKKKKNLYGEEVKVKEEPFVKITQEDLEADLKYGHDEDASLEVQAKHTDWEDEAEARMDIIGQNGNDGIHYAEEGYTEKEKEEEKVVKVGYQPPPLDVNQEILELGRILGQDLTADQIDQIKKSKATRALGNADDDDLVIKY